MPKMKTSQSEPIEINYDKKLPDAEFDVMNAIWQGNPPVNTSYLMDAVGKDKGWKAPTLISFLVRLEERGYISSSKNGKERQYVPVADMNKYMKNVTVDFVDRYHGGSFVKLMDTLFADRNLSESDIDDLLAWLKSKY